MAAGPTGCQAFREALHRFLDDNMELVGQATFVGHLATCARCRNALLEFSDHIQAHRILEAGGTLDAESVSALTRRIPADFASVSERIVRKRARELGRLKFQILQVYLKHLLSEHVWPEVLAADELDAAQAASERLLTNLERFKESNLLFADGGLVDLNLLRNVLERPLDAHHDSLELQLRHIARGLLTARTLDPTLDEYVLHLLGVILERLGHYEEALQMFQALASLTPRDRPYLRAQALNSAAHTAIRYLERFSQAEHWLEEALKLYPGRWTLEYNLASLYLWPSNPARDRARGAAWFARCIADAPRPEALAHLLDHDPIMLELCRREALWPPQATSSLPEH